MRYSLLLFILMCLFPNENKISPELKRMVDEATRDINKAADFILYDINGKKISLSDYKGRVVLINFWATWCGPCRMEIPDLKELKKKYGKRGFEVLGISISDKQSMLKKFSDAYDITYPLLYGSSSEMGNIAANYGGLQAVPQSFLVDSDGRIVLHFPGAILKNYDPRSFNMLEQKIVSSLASVEISNNKLNRSKK